MQEATKTMPAHIERVMLEKIDLDEKIHKLRTFIGTEQFSKLTMIDRRLLEQQLYPMQQYSDCLAQRLAQFWSPENYSGAGNSPIGHCIA